MPRTKSIRKKTKQFFLIRTSSAKRQFGIQRPGEEIYVAAKTIGMAIEKYGQSDCHGVIESIDSVNLNLL